MNEIGEKYRHLQELLKAMGRVAVAFSGGVDSAFLLDTAVRTLGAEQVTALTAQAEIFPHSEQQEAAEFAMARGVRQLFYPMDIQQIEGFTGNPPDRCYRCKKTVLSGLQEALNAAVSESEATFTVIDGSNTDDEGDYRPGSRALREMNVRSPLKEAGLSKQEIRTLSREAGLSIWDKPSMACLASRFPYGETITKERLRQIDAAETALRQRGLSQVRVRVHGDLARIETDAAGFARIMAEKTAVSDLLRQQGFTYVSLDLAGYRTGSMNEALNPAEKEKR